MPDKKQTWSLIVSKTKKVVISHEPDLDVIKVKSLKLIEEGEDYKYLIQRFINKRTAGTDELSVYFS